MYGIARKGKKMPCTHYDILSFTFPKPSYIKHANKARKTAVFCGFEKRISFYVFYINITLIIPCFCKNALNKADIKDIFNINFFTNFRGVKLE